ncbi:hypothetical protein DESA109040_22685 [Deinococcus saxicola]|uniref:hypothetical protein n=2 Tax=Deinococcus saxicola TaxID=249406 RepID=UPI0039F14C0C
MSFFKRLFGGAPIENQQPQTAQQQAPAAPMTEAVKSMLFNVYGSEIYDDMVWLGQHQPGVTPPVYRGLEYIAQAIQQLQPTIPDAAALVHQYTAQSLGGLRRSLTASPEIVARFFVNAVEFQARVEYAVSTLSPMSLQDAGSIEEWLRNEDVCD